MDSDLGAAEEALLQQPVTASRRGETSNPEEGGVTLTISRRRLEEGNKITNSPRREYSSPPRHEEEEICNDPLGPGGRSGFVARVIATLDERIRERQNDPPVEDAFDSCSDEDCTTGQVLTNGVGIPAGAELEDRRQRTDLIHSRRLPAKAMNKLNGLDDDKPPALENGDDANECSSNSIRYYSVMFGKPSTRKNRTWEDDGYIEVSSAPKGATVILKSTTGDVLGQSTLELSPDMFEELKVFKVGNKEIQIQEQLSTAPL